MTSSSSGPANCQCTNFLKGFNVKLIEKFLSLYGLYLVKQKKSDGTFWKQKYNVSNSLSFMKESSKRMVKHSTSISSTSPMRKWFICLYQELPRLTIFSSHEWNWFLTSARRWQTKFWVHFLGKNSGSKSVS